jgi:DNA-binding transcriptional LysR family regulator
MTSVKLSYLRYFVALAEERHFSRAAMRLGIAQPALSQQIRRLEQLVGHQLVRRKPRVELTEAGAVLLRVARRTLEQVEEGIEATRRAARGETGSLTVGFPASVLLTQLASAVQAYRQRYPEVELKLRELSTAAQLEALRAGTVDVGFLREPRKVDESLVAEPILEEPFVIALPSDHPHCTRRSVKLKALAEEPFVLFPREVAPGLYDRVISMCQATGFTPRVVQEALEWLTIVALVDTGLGISIVPGSFEKLRWGGVMYRRISSPRTSTSICLGMRREAVAPPARRFVDVVREVSRTR